jgi:flagella basal body P-ring formation protein FlgA
MNSSARLALVAIAVMALTAAGASAQAASKPSAARASVPAPLAAAVGGAIAGRWAVDSMRVRLEWGSVPGAAVLSAATPFHLVGKGDDGWFVALFGPAAGSPVAIRVHAGVLDSVSVAARALGTGVELVATDLRRDARVRWGVPAAAALAPAEGRVTRRPLAEGDAISDANATPPQVVRSGDAVRLEWRRGGVIVALDGVALGSAAMGQTVRVRIAERGGQRSGRVTGPNAVRLDS